MLTRFWHGNRIGQGYKATIALALLGITQELLDNYWVFTSVPLIEDHNSDTSAKFFYMLAQLLINAAAYGARGLTLDYLRKMFQKKHNIEESNSSSLIKFWRGSGIWHGYKATTALAFVGIAKELLDNYWVFTATPMVEGQNSDASTKFFYTLAQLLVNAAISGADGLTLDYLRSIFLENYNAEESNLLSHPA